MTRQDRMEKILREATQVLKQEFEWQPILFASAAIEKIIGKSFHAQDIDLLVPNQIQKQQSELIRLFSNAGFSYEEGVVPTFVKEGIVVELSNLEQWVKKCQWSLADMTKDETGVQYQVLGREDLIKLYQVLIEDPSRAERKKQFDQRKLSALLDSKAKNNNR
ncbi:MAG: hypothetical protein PHS68_03245 [Candidatus Izemoplasmatales bacterium]|nr:hypothetical protein [Candidatus Izemoplasmatales bacterium]